MGIFSNRTAGASRGIPEGGFIRLGPEGTVLKEAGAVLSNECRAFWMMKTGNGGESRLELPIRGFFPHSSAAIDFCSEIRKSLSAAIDFPFDFSSINFPKLTLQRALDLRVTKGYQDRLEVSFELFLRANQKVGKFYIARWKDKSNLQFSLDEFLEIECQSSSELWILLDSITTNAPSIPTLIFSTLIINKDNSLELIISLHHNPLLVASELRSAGLKS